MADLNYLDSAVNQFKQYKTWAERSMIQVPEEKLDWQYNSETNSIAVIVKHMVGNMLSRFSDFLTTDGEKSWRDRDVEFENETLTRAELNERWNQGWDCVFNALKDLKADDLQKKVNIRNEVHTVVDAINRQLTHYANHVGQIIFISKMIVGADWKTLTIARKGSAEYNAQKGL